MDSKIKPTEVTQLRMSGMLKASLDSTVASCCTVEPGADVLYIGKVGGGPRYGSRGIVKMALHRKAIVDMGRMGTWHVPYYFLGLPKAV